MKQLSLTWFELYKLFSRKSIWVLFGIMVLCFYLPIQILAAHNTGTNGYYQSTPPTKQEVLQAQRDLKKVVAEIQQVPQRSQKYSALQNSQSRDQLIISSSHGTVIRGTLNGLEHKLQSLKASGDTGFTYHFYSYEYAMLKHLPFIGFGFHMGGPGDVIQYIHSYGFFILSAMVMFGLSYVFAEEYAIGTDNFLLTTKYGKRRVATAKLFSSLIYVGVVSCILFVVNLASNLTLFGVTGLEYPMQSFPMFSGSPFNLSIGQFIVVASLIQLFGGLVLGVLVLLLSSCTRHPLIAFFLSCGFLLVPEIVIKSFPNAVWAQTIMRFSYMGVMETWGLFQNFIAYSLFGHPILYPTMVIAFVVLISVPVAWMMYFVFSRHQVE